MLLDLPFLFKLQDEFKYGRLPPGVVVNYLGLDYCNALQFSVRLHNNFKNLIKTRTTINKQKIGNQIGRIIKDVRIQLKNINGQRNQKSSFI